MSRIPQHLMATHMSYRTPLRFVVILLVSAVVTACTGETPVKESPAPAAPRPLRPLTAAHDDRALRAGRHRRRPQRSARQRAPGAGQARRRGANHGRALPSPGLVGQRRPARDAGPPDGRVTRCRRHAALLPDQQGPVVAARSQQGVRARRAGEARRRQLLSRRRDERRSPEMDRLAAGDAKPAATGFFTTIRRGPDGRFAAVPYSVEYQGELALRLRCCAKRRSSRRSRRSSIS